MSLALRAITGLIAALVLSLTSDAIPPSSSEEANVHALKEQYRLLLEERDRLLQRNRLLSAELRLALSNALYLVIHIQPPVIQLKTQATILEEYEVSDLHMDRVVEEQLSAKGFLQLRLRGLREMPFDSQSNLAEREGSTQEDEDRAISAIDSLAFKPRTLYTLELNHHTTLYMQRPLGKEEDPPGRMRSFLKAVEQWFAEAWNTLFSHKKGMYIAVDERDAMRLFRSLRVGMPVLLVE